MLFKEKSWNQSHKKLTIPNISENTCSFYASPVFIEILGFLRYFWCKLERSLSSTFYSLRSFLLPTIIIYWFFHLIAVVAVKALILSYLHYIDFWLTKDKLCSIRVTWFSFIRILSLKLSVPILIEMCLQYFFVKSCDTNQKVEESRN